MMKCTCFVIFETSLCCCRPTNFRAHCVNTKQLQSADINKGKRGLCQESIDFWEADIISFFDK